MTDPRGGGGDYGSGTTIGAQARNSSVLNDKPRLLVVAQSLDVGGAERHLSAVLPELARRGWPVSIYCMNRLGAFADSVRAKGVDVIAPPIERKAGHQQTSRRLVATALAGSRLIGVMRRVKPTIAHFFLPEPYLIGAPPALMLRIPVCIMSRRGLNLYQQHWRGSAAIERRLHRCMTAVLANSRRVTAELEAEGVAPNRIGLIYNGVALDGIGAAHDRPAIRASLGLGPGDVVAIVVANLIPYKGHADLLAAIAGVRKQLPAAFKVICIGRDEGARASLESLRSELGLDEVVSFLGVRNDVPALLAAADLSILPSHEEGFSNAVIEAMASGLATIVTDVGGNPEAITNGETGLVVPPRQPSALGAALAQLANDAALRARLGSAAALRARERFSLSRSVDRYETVYRGLLAGRLIGDLELD